MTAVEQAQVLTALAACLAALDKQTASDGDRPAMVAVQAAIKRVAEAVR